MTKYEKWYSSIIENAKNTPRPEYTENHHIVPKSMGGTNKKSNLVALSYKEHIICHLLLERMTRGTEHHLKLLKAYVLMCAKKRGSRPVSDTIKLEYKRRMRERMTGNNNPFFGRTHSEESRRKNSNSKLGIEPWNKGLKSPTRKVYIKKNIKRTWKLTDPLNNEYFTSNLKMFCSDHKLTQSCLHNLMAGRLQKHKNWKCIRVE